MSDTSHIYGCEHPRCGAFATLRVEVWNPTRGEWEWHDYCTAHEPPQTIRGKRVSR